MLWSTQTRNSLPVFGYIEAQAKAMGKDIKELTLEEMDKFWNEAKQNENQ